MIVILWFETSRTCPNLWVRLLSYLMSNFVPKEAGLNTACSHMVVWEGGRTSWCKLENLLQYCVWQQVSKPVVIWWEQVTDTMFVWFCFVCVKEAVDTLCHSTKAFWCVRFTLISVPSCRIMVLCNKNQTYWQEPTSVGNSKGSSPCLNFFKQWYSNSITYM